MPLVSVIVPAFNNSEHLEACLRSVRESDFEDFELLVADDGSEDAAAIAATAARWEARLIRLAGNRGPAAARNEAARVAQGEILLFLDADVTVRRGTLRQVAEAFARDPGLDAVIGSYDAAPAVSGTVALFRNLLHCHVHHRSAGAASTFWAGCGAVRRDRFWSLGGFDATYSRPSIEDVEFGMRLDCAGGRLEIDPRIQVKHHKEWSLASMFRTDALDRACPWTELMLRHGLPKGLNFRWQDRASVLLSLVLAAVLLLAIVHGWRFLALGGILAGVFGLLNSGLYRFLCRLRGPAFAVRCFPLHVLHHWAAIVGLVLGLVRHEQRRDRWLPVAAAALAIAIFGLIQGAGGAFTAEFSGYPDESAHFMTGLMIRDYLLTWPPAPPLPFAEQYYLHYPKVAFGHWPPLFHVLEAGYWLLLPPSRATAMVLVGGIGFAAALWLYRMARAVAPWPAALLTALLLTAAPAFQDSVSQVMSDGLSLLFGTLFLHALVRCLDDRSRFPAVQLGLWGAAALLVKGTGAVLVVALALVVFASGRWRAMTNRRTLAVAGLALLPCAAWYGFQQSLTGDLMGWAGMRGTLPWGIPSLIAMAGPGMACLAALRLVMGAWWRVPMAAASAALVASAAGMSFFWRAMNEPRHFLLILPALLLLALTALQRLWQWRPAAALCAAGGVLLVFPWTICRQQPVGFTRLVSGLRQPARMLISAGHGFDEGSLVVAVAVREVRPGSMVARASKLLAQSSWMGTGYRQLVHTPVEVIQLLDRFAIDTVVAAGMVPAARDLPHHHLLVRTITAHANWSPCGASGAIRAFCRVPPPEGPREPLRLDFTRRLGRTLTEAPRRPDAARARPQ